MYIPPFVCGIFFTILVEVVALIIYGIFLSGKDK